MEKKVYLNLEGTDGNALAVLGSFRKAARNQNFEMSEVEKVIKGAMNGDYQHLLGTILANTTTVDPEVAAAKKVLEKDTDDGGQYWGNEGNFQELQDKYWDELVPSSGKASSPHGELLRMVNRFYYDCYNNGLCNDKSEEVKYMEDNMNKLSPFLSEVARDIMKSKFNSYMEQFSCTNCGGRGVYDEHESCNHCNDGSNMECCYDCPDDEDESCSVCGGSGEVEETCEECGGSGVYFEEYNCSCQHEWMDMFCYSKALDDLVDAIVLYVDSIESKKVEEKVVN